MTNSDNTEQRPVRRARRWNVGLTPAQRQHEREATAVPLRALMAHYPEPPPAVFEVQWPKEASHRCLGGCRP